MDRKKLLIIGCGDLGERLAAQVADEYEVYGLRRNPPASGMEDIHYLRGDAADGQAMASVLQREFDAIVLTLTPTGRGDEGYRRGYVEPCQVLVRALAGRQPRVILVSSTSVYGQSDGQWLDEAAEAMPTRYNGERLLQAETVLAEAGLPLVVLRLAGIYGPGRTRLVQSVAEGKAKASPAYTNRIHADDAAGFMAWVLRMEQPDALYLVSDGEAPSKAEVVNWLAEQLGVARPAPEDAENLNKRIDNRRMLATGYQLQYCGYREGFSKLIPQ
ncbi:SDR family oxidoreductase [Gilvimarinus sp. DA14]|uniref:SDR family oxidoreductase n=1 Tax=Gilvimarinus sp. DA14 TaxID=2956798 RepID=UPI0020B88E2E|nr:SDR family oxidoreductase [Gilvimarinus sp. DA14]UTF58800.1 SDR family oxidoreductase [Gilvimarinus sp. DA14]